MKIITISGLDGSGKSTQLNILKEYLSKKNKKIFYFHAIDFSIGNKVFFWKHKKNKKTDTGITKANQLTIQLRKIALYVDILRFRKLTEKLAKKKFDFILSDRFFYDIIVNIEYLSGKNFNLPIDHILRKYDLISFYIKTNPQEIIKRSRRPKQGLKYLKIKNTIFNNKRHVWHWKIIDGNDSIEKVFEKIRKSL